MLFQKGMFPLRAFYWGHVGARDNFSLQIRNIVESGYRVLGERPIVIGECGVPMDMKCVSHMLFQAVNFYILQIYSKGDSFDSDNWIPQLRMMDAMITALERSLVGFTCVVTIHQITTKAHRVLRLWNYNPDNDDHIGDNWNGENFSWFSRRRALPASLLNFDQASPTLDNGARILRSVVRPYPAKTAGIPLRFKYEMNTGQFTYEWVIPEASSQAVSTGAPSVDQPPRSGHPTLNSRETEIFLPSSLMLDRKFAISGLGVQDTFEYDLARQTLFIRVSDMSPGRVYNITFSPDPPPKDFFRLNSLWDDFGSQILAVIISIIAIITYFMLM